MTADLISKALIVGAFTVWIVALVELVRGIS